MDIATFHVSGMNGKIHLQLTGTSQPQSQSTHRDMKKKLRFSAQFLLAPHPPSVEPISLEQMLHPNIRSPMALASFGP
ncbi:unnamed protein product [Protopolystoma xenopodis]|uniref:Uncharacterized protein n=1 Tax=Protopolystoma xenopodis TaxID=117903 RepID=A0A3S5BQQ8_9PLAT|nr:unnamed protein product [Protopolystoma xenopodis]